MYRSVPTRPLTTHRSDSPLIIFQGFPFSSRFFFSALLGMPLTGFSLKIVKLGPPRSWHSCPLPLFVPSFPSLCVFNRVNFSEEVSRLQEPPDAYK